MDKKNFLFVSLTGLISDIAWQVSKEGHEVRYFIGDKKERDIADGFVAKSKDWEKDKDWADMTLEFTARFGYHHNQYSTGGDDHPHRAVLVGPCEWFGPKAESTERVPNRRAHRCATFSLR